MTTSLTLHAFGVTALACMFGCQKDAAVTLTLAPLAHDYAFNFQSQCRLASDEDQCYSMAATGGDVELTPDEGAEPGGCLIILAIIDRCEQPALELLRGEKSVNVFDDTEADVIAFAPTDFSRAFDFDVDSFSNYLEWTDGTDPRAATSTPEGDPDL